MDYDDFRAKMVAVVQERAADANVVGPEDQDEAMLIMLTVATDMCAIAGAVVGSLECDVKSGGLDVLVERCEESLREGVAKSNLLIQRVDV